jgi:TonB-dependent SusC/RagA subfamily outer membrane receptor
MEESVRILKRKKAVAILAIAFLLLCPGTGASAADPASGGSAAAAAQQNVDIRGRVVDQNGLPVIGASVFQAGTRNGAVTDVDGYFSISVPVGAALQVECMGYKGVSVQASNGMVVSLSEDAQLLSEVVVVGYGTQRRADITGSVASVDVGKTLESRPIADVGRGLQGAVPGMNVRIPTGEIGSDPIIKIRGQIGSISGGSAPLILLDNVEIPSIQLVNPNDIESITVLKDAASASIYGSKAAFGVILITTKTGAQATRLQVSYSNNFSWQNPAKPIEIGGIEALQYTYDSHVNRQSPMPAGGFWRINDESLVKIREWQEKYGSTVSWNDPILYGRDWYFDGVNKYGYRLYDGIKAMVRE